MSYTITLPKTEYINTLALNLKDKNLDKANAVIYLRHHEIIFKIEEPADREKR